MIKAVKINKSKSWIDTYGKVFTLRRAFKLAHAYAISNQYAFQVRTIRSADGDPERKNKAIASLRVRPCQAIDHLNINQGFANKG